MYKMLEISVETYTKNEVHTITIGNIRLFWVRIYDVQEELGIKNISDLVRKKFRVFLRLTILQKIRLKSIKGLGKNGLVMIFIVIMFVVILF